MKKLTALLLCLVLCLSCVTVLAACNEETPDTSETKGETNASTEAPTDAATETPTEEPTEAPTEEVTDAATEEGTDEGSETQDPANLEYDPDLYVVIRTAEDLMAFNKAVNEDGEYFDDMTVIFLDDIDMTGYTWTPLDGLGLFGVTFDGQGHTISNLQFADHAPEAGTDPSQMGSGFVGVASADMTFMNLTFDNCRVTAYERAVGNFIGVQTNGYITFENCKSLNFTAEGWMDSNNQDVENGGHPISFRLAGFVGHNMAGNVYFTNCHVENIKLSGFHNLAAFVGYGCATLDEYCFEDCTVKNADFTFSYCLSSSYTADMPRKFVSVFFNGVQWVDNIDACVEMGNTFEGVSFYDWADDNAEYTPSDFRSWTAEEANAG